MVPKRKTYFCLIAIIVLAFLTLNTAFPKYFNRLVDFVNAKTFLSLPHFPEIPFKLGLDLQGGSYLVYEADLSETVKEETEGAMQGLRDVIERRVNLFGVGEPSVRIQEEGGSQRLVVELPGVKDTNEAIKEIGRTPYLEFKEETQTQPPTATATEAEMELSFKSTGLTGRYLQKAEVIFDKTTFVPQVNLSFNKEGAEIFKELTGRNVGKRIAIYIDGVPISAPVVQEVIPSGNAQITGNFTIDEARSLARNLNAGALPVPINLISQETIGPALGKISLAKSLKAGVFGFSLVIIFMLVFYRLSGFCASLALLIYVGVLLCIFKLVPVTLTLAGIGGVILSIGMAVDANVLVFERQREERKKGEDFSHALKIGFSRAWPSIRDSNLTTLLIGLIMFSFGTSFIKGFALTLSLGIFVSMFSALFVTRTFLKLFVGTKLEKIRWLWR